MKNLLFSVVLVALLGSSGASAVTSPYPDSPYISDFAINYYLDRDSDQRSTLDVTEKITVQFPQDKNKGIVREIPREYDGHSVGFRLESLTRNGSPETIYSQENIGKFHVIETGTDDYISGEQVFEFKYSMRDVTRYFKSTDSDEFYWDTNGTGWRSRIDNLQVNLEVAEGLQSSLTGKNACYLGSYGSTERCQVEKTDSRFSLEAKGLGAGENVTIAIGFLPGTFADYEPTLVERIVRVWQVLLIVTSVVGVALFVWFIVRARRWEYRSSELGTIVPEYIPPKNASVAVSAAVEPSIKASTLPAELTDLAVRHYIQILETREKSFWRAAEYDIKITRNLSELRPEEQEVISDMFGHLPEVDERLALKELKNDTATYRRFSDNDKKIKKLLKDRYKLKVVDKEKRQWYSRRAKALMLLAVLTVSPVLLVVAIAAFIWSKTLLVLSDEGVSLRRYLKGLEMYIKVAEKDRLKMTQSPEGAEKVKAEISDPSDPAQLVKLYERLLPYAILLGQEKEWSKRLGNYYQETNTSPDWYSSNTAFNAMMFSSMVSNFSSSVNATSASSSSSGGSSGGGYSGGGGGGGGGGFR